MNTLLNIPLPQAIVWGLIGLLGVALMIFLAVLEGRHFAGQNLRPAWLRLRLTSLPILALAIGAVWLTVIAVRSAGFDPLAVAYAALFSIGAFVYFVLHLLAGRLYGLGRGHAAWIAFSGLVLIGVVPALGGTLFPFADLALKIAKEGAPVLADGLRRITPESECAGERIRLPDLPGRGRPDAFRLRIDHTPATGPTWYDFPTPVQEKQS